jgi:hypothetical protein
MHLNDHVVYRCLRLWPVHQLHPGHSCRSVRHNDCPHRPPFPTSCAICPERNPLQHVTAGRHLIGVKTAVPPTTAVIRDASLTSPPDQNLGA